LVRNDSTVKIERLVQSYPEMLMTQPTIAVAMSGGVDSSAVAAMLRADGHSIVGLTMQLWNQRRLAGHAGMPESVQGRCCSIDDVYDARRVAEKIGIPYYVVNHEARFERDVVKPFVREYLAGRTPIPCSLCNNFLKFDEFLVMARQIGAEKIATGHYARVAYSEGPYSEGHGRWLLQRPVDRAKDQTYFLFGLTQEQLSRTLFPLGGMTKAEVREIARQHGSRSRRKSALSLAAITSNLSKPILRNRARRYRILPESW
jgi:tRNA-specific 2-thiouridylase